MKYIIDTQTQTIATSDQIVSLYSQQGFTVLSEIWLKVGWNARYHYLFKWMGQPILQLPEDLLRLQEVIFKCQPDVIIETGIGMGGGLLFYATVCCCIGKGRIIGIDVNISPHKRKILNSHPLSSYISLIEGGSTKKETFAQIQLKKEESVLVILDSNHTKNHVLKELELYSQLVTPDSYLIVTDGFKKKLTDVPRGKKRWEWDNPVNAIEEFLVSHPEFVLDFLSKNNSEYSCRETITHFHNGWLRKTRCP